MQTTAICGSDLRVWHVEAGSPGSRHDSYAFRCGSFWKQCEDEGYMNGFCILGDPAYMLRPWLLVPYKGANLTPEQFQFNKELSRMRVVIERTFGRIVGK